MHKRRVLYRLGQAVPNGGQGYFPQDIRRLYNFPSDLDGSGQTIGLLEFSSGYSLRDARQFWHQHGVPIPSVTFISVDGTPNDRGRSPDDEEASLDLQWAGALAPGSRLVVYEANAGDTYDSFAAAMLRSLNYVLQDTQNRPSVLSISYGDGEVSFSPAMLQQWAQAVAALDAQGVTVCVAAGDQGAYGLHDLSGPPVPHADTPASLPQVIAVGGTSLQPDGTETVWNNGSPDAGGATGGGFSAVFSKPPYQQGVPGAWRGLPDVACNADPLLGYQIVFQDQLAVVGGTSVACPVFAAVVALANQRRAQLGLPPLSGLAARLYDGSLATALRDITQGDNSFNGVPGYSAGPGWDPCSGWGSFDAARLIDLLSQDPQLPPSPAAPPRPPHPHHPRPRHRW